MKLKQEHQEFDYNSILQAVLQGNLEILRQYQDKIPETLIGHFSHQIFANAIENNKLEMINQLLINPGSFSIIEQQFCKLEETASFILSFVDRKILELKARKPPFDLSDEKEIRLGFYLARNLIRRNAPARNDDLLFLLNIPAIRCIAQTEVTQDRPNELMHLALAINNTFAEKALYDLASMHFINEMEDFSKLRKQNINFIFDDIVQLTRNKAKEYLMELAEMNIYDEYAIKDGCSPAVFFAKMGDSDSVELLVEVFKLDRNPLAEAFARKGFIAQVNQQLLSGGNLDYAASGYAEGGYFDELALLEKEANPGPIMLGYAMGGRTPLVNELLAKKDLRPATAAYGYACRGRFEEVNIQVAAGARKQAVVEAYYKHGYIHQNNILRLMALTDDDELRRLLGALQQELDPASDIDNLYQHATRLNQKLRPQKQEKWDSNTLCETIYQFAKDENEQALAEMVQDGVCLGVFNKWCPLRLLAREGLHQAVEMLVYKFRVDPRHAVRGYIEGGFFRHAKLLLDSGAYSDLAIMGYAYRGDFKKMEKMLVCGADKNHALIALIREGYGEYALKLIENNDDRSSAAYAHALTGNIDEVNQLLLQGAKPEVALEGYCMEGEIGEADKLIQAGANRDSAAQGFARAGNREQACLQISLGAKRNSALYGFCAGGQISLADQQIAAGGDRDLAVQSYAWSGFIDAVNTQIRAGADRESAVQGYENAHFLDGNEKGLLRLMVYTEDIELRRLLAEKAKIKNDGINPETFMRKAQKMNHIAETRQLNDYREILFWIEKTPGQLAWILEGYALVRSNIIHPELFWIITEHVLNLPPANCTRVVSAIRIHVLPERVQAGFFSQKGGKESSDLVVDVLESGAILH